MTSRQGDGTAMGADGPGRMIGGYPARTSATPESESEDALGLGSGGQSATGGRGSVGGSVSEPDAGSRPTTPIRSTQLAALANEVGHDTGIVERFVVDFLALLEERLDIVASSLAVKDLDPAVVTLRSLETTGAMLGASDLVTAVADLRAAVRDQRSDLGGPLDRVLVSAEALRTRLAPLVAVPAEP